MDITNPVFPLRCSARPLLQLHSLLVFWASAFGQSDQVADLATEKYPISLLLRNSCMLLHG